MISIREADTVQGAGKQGLTVAAGSLGGGVDVLLKVPAQAVSLRAGPVPGRLLGPVRAARHSARVLCVRLRLQHAHTSPNSGFNFVLNSVRAALQSPEPVTCTHRPCPAIVPQLWHVMVPACSNLTSCCT